VKFGVIADCQYADVGVVDIAPQRKFRKSKEKLKEAVDLFNKQDIEFVIHLGDFIDHDIAGIEKLNEITSKLNKPLFHIFGNHDFYEEWPNEKLKNSKEDLLKLLSMPAPYYEKVFGCFRFVFLDSNEVGIIESEVGSKDYEEGMQLLQKLKLAGNINAKSWNGTISNEQLKWLVSRLIEADKLNQKVILLAHHPVYPEHRENMLEYDKILDLFSEHRNVVAYLNGHNHDGNEGIFNNVPCITFKGMVDTDENSYSVVELTNNELLIKGYGREKSRKFKTRG
jgi:manganese-dependent ADP-ribose/CDP-alcohol diphosphatase